MGHQELRQHKCALPHDQAHVFEILLAAAASAHLRSAVTVNPNVLVCTAALCRAPPYERPIAFLYTTGYLILKNVKYMWSFSPKSQWLHVKVLHVVHEKHVEQTDKVSHQQVWLSHTAYRWILPDFDGVASNLKQTMLQGLVSGRT